MTIQVSLVSIREDRQHLPTFAPQVAASFSSRIRIPRCLLGLFSFSAFFSAPRLCQPNKEPEQSTRQRSSMASVTRSTERNIRGCRNKNRPNGTSSLADHGLVFGGAVRLAPGKQMLPGKSWMAPVMVWPLQPVGAFAHKASLKELELMCRETGHRTVAPISTY